MHVFRARELQPVERRLEPGEEIDVVLLAPDRLRAAIADGELEDGKSLAAFHLWASSAAHGGGE
jgi:hypothetical protein